MADFEYCLDQMKRIRTDPRWSVEVPARNEAQTRLELIDVLLTECLGWTRDSILVESSVDGTYSDYELGRPTRQVVIEAKREEISFELPAGFTRPTVSLRQLDRDGPGVGSAIRQAMRYGQARAISIAAVANGHQLVLFVASRVDGVPPMNGRGLVFDSLLAMEGRFQELWDALSPQGVAARRLFRQLDADQIRPPPQKLSSTIIDYPGWKNRNPVAAELQILGGMFLEDILSTPEVEPEFLKECYTASGTLSQYALVSREILTARYSVFLEAEAEATLQPARSKTGIAKELLSDVFAASDQATGNTLR